jgi:uncharacterized protein YacL
MWTFIIFMVLSTGIGFWIGYRDWQSIFEGLLTATLGLIIGCIIALLVAFLLPSRLIEKKDVATIVNLQDNSSLSGRFFLGSGQINDKMVYVFYYESSPGIYKMQQIGYENAVIKYTTDTTAFVEQYTKVLDKTYFWNHFSIDNEICNVRYVINVPKGTIKTNFQLDAQ